MIVPVRIGDRVIGVLNILKKTARQFTQADVDLAMAFADQAAIAVEKTRLLQVSEARATQMQTLAELTQTVSSTLNLQRVLEFIVDAAVRLLGLALARVWEVEEASGDLVMQACAGDSDLIPYPRSRFRSGEGMVGKALQQKETISIHLPAEDPRYLQREWADAKGIMAAAGIPLLIGNHALGVLSAIRRLDKPFTPEELQLLTSFANHAAIAMQNARLFQETQIRAEKLRILAGVSRTVTATLDPQQVFDMIIQASSDLLDASVATLWTLEGEELILGAGRGLHSDLRVHRRFRLGEGMVGWVAEHMEPVVIPEFAEDPRVKNREWAMAEGFHGFAGAPLVVERRCVGVLTVLRTSPEPFDAEEIALLAAFADQAALALENAKLYEQVKRHAQELEHKVEDRTRALKEAQDELVKKERLAVLGQLAGGVGHELRNPLGVIKNSVYYLKLRLQDADEKEQRHLTIMEREIGIANKITTDLLDFSRIKEPSRMSTDLNELVQETLAQYPVEPEIELRTELDPHLPSVTIDKDQIRQVFLNMIMNAVQAMPQGGHLTVNTSVERGFALVSFTDTGCGIPKENLGNIFQPLFTTKAKGLGLGLAVSKSLLNANKGEIAVESQVGRGTTFRVKFPTT